jgi:hypothetical protein
MAQQGRSVRGGVARQGQGPLTFGEIPPSPLASPLLSAVLETATSQIGVRETQPNRGAEVDEYVASVGLDPAGARAWCQAFIYWCFQRAAITAGVPNPCVRTAGVLDHWHRAPSRALVDARAAFDDRTLVRPGAIFVIDHGGGLGHAGLITGVTGAELQTIEGNTNERGSREGDGVYRKSRWFAEINVGFIDYAR